MFVFIFFLQVRIITQRKDKSETNIFSWSDILQYFQLEWYLTIFLVVVVSYNIFSSSSEVWGDIEDLSKWNLVFI